MTRDDGWRFLSLGRHLERLLVRRDDARSTCGGRRRPATRSLLEWLLDLSDSLITYRARYLRAPSGRAWSTCCSSTQRNPRSARLPAGKLAKHVRICLPGCRRARRIADIEQLLRRRRARSTRPGQLFVGDAVGAWR